MDRKTAEYINDLFLEYSSKLSDSVGVMREKCSKEEAEKYVKPVSHVLTLNFDVLDIVYEQYPDLKPEGLD